MGTAGDINGNLGLYSKEEPYRPRGRDGRFIAVRQSHERRAIIKRTIEMRRQEGLPPLDVLKVESREQ